MHESDTIILGAGVIGLSLAYELACRGQRVSVLERGCVGEKASWAAAGILPAVCSTGGEHDDFERLKSMSWRVYPDWIQRLKEDSACDPEFQRTGGIQLATTIGELVALQVAVAQWQADGIQVEAMTSLADWRAREPALESVVEDGSIRGGFWLPGECVVRPPRLLKSLVEACRNRNVAISEEVQQIHWTTANNRIVGLNTNRGNFFADQYCIAAGAWSASLARDCGVSLEVQPWRGQMVLFRSEPGRIRTVINQGPNYLVPRKDGRILVGSTVEEVGFDEATTECSLGELQRFAASLIPALSPRLVERSWAGLRPAIGDGRPLMGKSPGFENLFVSTGHFRSGIFLAPAAAHLMAQVITGESPDLDLAIFHVARK